MPAPARFLPLFLLLAQGAFEVSAAQEVGDICPLGVRLSSGRASRGCLDLRRLPMPASLAIDTSAVLALLPFRSTGS